MHYLDYNEQIQHKTGRMPMAFYAVDEHHPRYVMRMHWHRETELIRVVRGEVRFYIDDSEVCAQAGDLLIVSEGLLHGGDPQSALYECLVFDPYSLLMMNDACKQALKPILGKTSFIKNSSIVSNAPFSEAMEKLFSLARQGIEQRELSIIGALFTFFGSVPQGDEALMFGAKEMRSGIKAEQVKPALEYIENNYGAHITLEMLARLTGFSPKYFCRCFRAIIHRSPIDYLNFYRVECAGYFLTSTDKTIAEIAQLCGFNDSSFFIKQFRKYKGVTPKSYRDSINT